MVEESERIRIKFQANGKKFVTFKAKYFGLFQAARMSQPITESKEEVVESTQITIKNSEGTSVIDEQGQFTPLKEGESTLPSIPPESIDEVTFPAKDELAPTEPTLDTKAATSIAQYSLLLSSNIILNTDKGSSVGEITLKRDDSTGESPNPDASPEVSFELVGEDAAPFEMVEGKIQFCQVQTQRKCIQCAKPIDINDIQNVTLVRCSNCKTKQRVPDLQIRRCMKFKIEGKDLIMFEEQLNDYLDKRSLQQLSDDELEDHFLETERIKVQLDQDRVVNIE